MDGELDYLQPGFDPATLTVPRLRSLLVEYDVAWPSSAKKPQLIELFNAYIAPRARKILSARSRTQRTSNGISDAGLMEDVEEEVAQTPQPRRSGRQSRAATEESMISAAPSVASRASRSTRRSSARPSEVSESEAERATPVATRRPLKSVNTPAVVKEELPFDEHESPFTQDNPFQSGSSPSNELQTDRRRRTTGTTGEKKRSSGKSRKTDVTPTSAIPSSRRSGVFAAQEAKREEDASDEEVTDEEAGEEFTVEEAELLKLEEEEGGKQLLPARRSTSKKSSSAYKIAPLAILLAIAGGVLTKWREEKIAVGYCGVGTPSTSLAGIEVPQWAESILPECEPCPPHAYCGRDLHTTCEHDFILHAHPLSLFGLVPLPPSCEADSEKAKRVQNVANKAVEELRERNAKFECGELKDEEGKRITQPEIVEEEVRKVVSSKRRKGMSQSEFEDLWQSAIGEIGSRDEIVTSTDGTSRTLRSNSLARIPLSCAIRRSLRLTLAKYLRQLAVMLLVLGSGAYGWSSVSMRRSTEGRAKQLASFAFQRLSTQAALHVEHRVSEPYISVGQLRDDILREEFSRARRERLWKRVVSKVESNSNVRPRVTETRTGEVTRVWEWIGAVERVESSPPQQQLEMEKRPVY